MVNPDYEPSNLDEEILEILKQDRSTPGLISEELDITRQQVTTRLRNLVAAGWVNKVTQGLYEFIEDPRVSQDTLKAVEHVEETLREVDELLAQGLASELPESVRESYSEKKTELYDYRNTISDLRGFLEECEDAGVFEDREAKEVAEEWLEAPQKTREEYLER